jgi:NAD/NADP transhydrogenase beta subunit
MDEINDEFPRPTSAGDRRQRRHQPGRATDPASPIHGMPILDVDRAAR